MHLISSHFIHVKLNNCNTVISRVSLGRQTNNLSCDLQHAASLALGRPPVTNKRRSLADPRALPPSEKLTNGWRPHMEYVVKDSAALQSRASYIYKENPILATF